MSVNKDKLIKMIDDATALEDRSIPIYMRHLKTAMFWSGLPPAQREQVRIQLGILQQESARHSAILGELRRKVQEDPRDVF